MDNWKIELRNIKSRRIEYWKVDLNNLEPSELIGVAKWCNSFDTGGHWEMDYKGTTIIAMDCRRDMVKEIENINLQYSFGV